MIRALPIRLRDRKGLALVWLALFMLPLIFMFAGLAIDMSYMYFAKNELQVAADAAALAGASKLTCEYDSLSVTAQTEARTQAQTFANKNRAAGSPVQVELNVGNEASGDIIVGYWAGGPDIGLPTGSSGKRIDAIKVVARRTSQAAVSGTSVGNNPVSIFFGRIFRMIGTDWSVMDVKAEAIAKGCIASLAPISVNEYWMGDAPIGSTSPAATDAGRDPYGIHHVYPNSFVRSPYGQINGNVNPLNVIPPAGSIRENGPLFAPCAGGDLECKKGKPTTNLAAGRVFAIVGGNARGNASAYNIFSLVDLDRRIGYSFPPPDGQWYKVSGTTFTPLPFADSNPDKDIAAGYIASGLYPNTLPIAVTEVYQPGYTAVSQYTSACGNADNPCASISYFTGQGLVGQMVNANFYDDGNYSGGRYAPGQKIIVAVYDGIVGDNGNQHRTTIVGFARVTIFGYGNNLIINPATGAPSVSGPHTTMYGYIAQPADFQVNFYDLPDMDLKSKLVK